MTLLIHAEEVEGCITWDEALDATEAAITELGRYGEQVNHPRQRLYAPSGARISMHAGASTGLGIVGMRIHGELPVVRSSSDKLAARKVLARGGDVYVLYSLDMKELLAIIIRGQKEKNLRYAGFVDFRVSCISAVGTKHLARKDSRVLGLFGSGWQARNHVTAFSRALNLREVKVYSPNPDHRKSFCDEMRTKLPLRFTPVDEPRAAVEGSDIILEATNTYVPIFDGQWLEPGVHITFITGSDKGLGRELSVVRKALDDETLRRSDLVYMCLREQVRQDRDGLFIDAIDEGTVGWEQLHELGDLLVGKTPGRTTDEQITLFRNNGGLGVVDMAIAGKIYDTAVARGIGTEL
jgi:alanine dehydrogenase